MPLESPPRQQPRQAEHPPASGWPLHQPIAPGSFGSGPFRRFTLYPTLPLPATYAGASLATAARGLVPLAQTGAGWSATLPGGVPLPALPLPALAAGGALLLSLWGGAVAGGDLPPLAPPVPLAAPPVPLSALEAALRRVRPAPFLPSAAPGHTLVDVDGKTVRTTIGAGRAADAVDAAGVRLAEDDRVHVLPPVGGSGERVVVRRAVPFSLVDGGVPTALRAVGPTVGEALQASGVAVHAADTLSPPAETPLAPGLKVTIGRALPVGIVAPDVQLETRTRAGTVGGLLAEQGVTVGPLDRVEPALGAQIPAYGAVRIVRVVEADELEQAPIPFRTRQQVQPGLVPGARVQLRVGAEGQIERTFRSRYEDGAVVERTLAGETRREPVDEIIGIDAAVAPPPAAAAAPASPVAPAAGGTQAPPPARAGAPTPLSPESVAAPPPPAGTGRAITMVATAYDPGPASTGKSPGHPAYGITASGMRAGYGVVAVDPRVIRLGTRLYVPGYGHAIAGDTGGAIKGNRIDLGFATYNEAIRYGRQTVTVYVLD